MKTEEAVKWISKVVFRECESMNLLEAKEVVELLQRGEKYKELYEVLCDNVGIIPKEIKL